MKVVKIELHVYQTEMRDFAWKKGNMAYSPGDVTTQKGHVIRVISDAGTYGEFAGGTEAEYSTLPLITEYLLGQDPLDRERIYSDVRRMLRQIARVGFAPVDIALWDLAGRHFDAPIHQLLGTYRRRLPCYASTTHGSQTPGLDSPQGYADFAVQCMELGYPAFKIHGKTDGPDIREEIATVRSVREAVELFVGQVREI
jgi:L-alanine-DL-glutamate epimerase-like enolase superfamily enzyme